MATCRGEKFEMMTSTVLQDRINSDAVRELLSPEDVLKVTKTIEMTQVKTSRYAGEKAKFVMPNLSNATPEGLVDMLGELREAKKDLEKLEGIYKNALMARLK